MKRTSAPFPSIMVAAVCRNRWQAPSFGIPEAGAASVC